MSTYTRFLTGSRYNGSFNSSLKCMDGFGVYTYPDGTEYRGYFKKGRFHGFGRLKLLAGNSFLVKGRFEEGELIDVEEIIFNDGLRFKGDIDGETVSSDKWRFMSETDRRFAPEINNGLDAVGPMTHLSNTRPARMLPRGCYDKVEGIYQPKSGFVSNIPKPFPPNRYVSCNAEKQWIEDNCRRGQGFTQDMCTDLEAMEPEPEICRKIIDSNVNAMKTLSRVAQSCACNEAVTREYYLTKMCGQKQSALSEASSDQSLPMTPSSSGRESFAPAQLVDNVKENTERELQSMMKIDVSESDSELSNLMEYRVSSYTVRNSHFVSSNEKLATDSSALGKKRKVNVGFRKSRRMDVI